MSTAAPTAAPAAERAPAPTAGGGGAGVVHTRRQRLRSQPAPLLLLFTSLLLVFPSEVVLAGPLRSNGAPARMVGMGVLVVLALDLMRARPHRRAVAEPVVVLVLLYAVQSLFFYGWVLQRAGTDPAGPLRDLLFSLSACGVALYAAVRVRTQRTVHQVIGILVAGCALSSVVGVLQAVGVDLAWADLLTLPGFDQAAPVAGTGDRYGLVRVVGTASHPIEYAVVLGSCLPLALHLVLHAGSARARKVAAAGAGLMAIALPFALSRGGVVCIATAVGIFLLVQPWGVRVTTLVLGGVAGCLAYVLAPNLASALVRLFTDGENDTSISGRTDDFPIVDAAFNAAPWLGGAPMPPEIFLDNQWFIVLTQRGAVGLVAFALLLVLPVAGLLLAAARSRANRPRQSLAAAIAGSITAIGVSGGVFDLLSFGQAAMLMFLLIGLSAAVTAEPAQPPGPASAQPARSAFTG